MSFVRACVNGDTRYIIRGCFSYTNHQRFLCSSTGTSKTDVESSELESLLDTNGDEELPDYSALRNISRLPENLHRKLNHELTNSERHILHANSAEKLSYERRLYATYGKISGINPGIMWPSLEELEVTIEDETEWEKPLSEMMSVVEKEKMEKTKAMLEKYVVAFIYR